MKKIIIYISIILVIIMLIVFGINIYVKVSTQKQIINEKYSDLTDIDCILVLGAGIWGDKPSHMLEDRLLQAIDLYKKGISSKIIMSGDHGQKEYDEVNVMKNYAIQNGVKSEDIFMDHAGFSSYESIYRAKEIFEAKKVIIVTQEYHLYRALYIANSLGIEAYGVGADPRQYVGATYRELREILARNKDFIKCIFKPEPTYLGESIPVSGNGDITNDDEKTKSDTTTDSFKLIFNERKDLEIKTIVDQNETSKYNYNIYSRGGDVRIKIEETEYDLREALLNNKITMEEIIIKANYDLKNKILQANDGGSVEYPYGKYTIIKLHRIDANRDVYIGNSKMHIDDIVK